MLGPVVKIDPETLPKLANLHWMGSKTYQELPAYIAGWDVGIMPFALNEATRYISPTKTPEFLAAGLPVVSTAIHDVIKPYGESGLVEIAGSAEQLVGKAEMLMQASPRGMAGAGGPSSAETAPGILPGRRCRGSSGASRSRKLQPTITATSGPRASARKVPRMFDWLIVGAGFAGSTLAERLASQRGDKVLVIDKRPHIGGNAYDRHNEAGLLIHQYGPHIFHTNSQAIFDHLSKFTPWRPYEHRVLAKVDGQLLPIPINLDTVNRLYGLTLREDEVDDFFASRAEHVPEIKTSEDVVVSRVGRELYEKFFRGYTRKQWGSTPRNSTSPSLPGYRCAPIGTIAISATRSSSCRCMAIPGCSSACSITPISR